MSSLYIGEDKRSQQKGQCSVLSEGVASNEGSIQAVWCQGLWVITEKIWGQQVMQESYLSNIT